MMISGTLRTSSILMTLLAVFSAAAAPSVYATQSRFSANAKGVLEGQDAGQETPVLADPAEKSQEELEKAFSAELSGCELRGFFTVGAVDKDQPLREERYAIQSVEKVGGDKWRFSARIQYAKIDVTVPMVLTVKWAGDTPMITITNMSIPLVGTYTARVMFYGGQYAGTWSGADHGGQMFGQVVTAEQIAQEKTAEEETETSEDKGDSKKSGGDGTGGGQTLVSVPTGRFTLDDDGAKQWPSYRGFNASGISEGASLPESWNMETGENVKWRQPVGGLCHSSPIVWDEFIFVTSAERMTGDAELKVGLYGSIDPVDDEGEHEFTVYCFDKNTGDLYWRKVANKAVPLIKRHPKGSHAASSPATNGEYVVAQFASEGLYCYTVEGELVWKRDFGVLDSGYYVVKDAQWGFASSPVIYEDKVIILCDVQDNSFLAVLDLATGEDVWKVEREDVPTWGCPTVHTVDGKEQILVNGYKHSGAYDFETGEVIWKLNGGGDIPVPTPIVAHDLIFLTSNHGRFQPVFAIDIHAKGELSMDADESDAMIWSRLRNGNYMQTPLVYGDYLYTCQDSGVLRSYEAKTGKEIYQQRLSDGIGFTASAVAGDGKLYFTSEEGTIVVLKAGPVYQLISENEMGVPCMATPALSEGILFIRTQNELVALSETEEGS